MPQKNIWTEENLTYLREHFPTEPGTDIAEALGCSGASVTQKARQLGLKKDPSFKTSQFIGRYVKRGESNNKKELWKETNT